MDNQPDPTKLHKELLDKLEQIHDLVLENQSSTSSTMNMTEAAKYTGRSRRTFQKEFREGIWTAIRVKGTGHPKFLAEDLNKDMAAWKELSRYRRI